MCTPGIAMGSTMLGGVVTGLGGFLGGDAEQRSAEYSATISDMNATLAARAADDARARGRIAESNVRTKTAQTIGTQRARAAANGIQLGFGTINNVISDTASFGEMDALNTRGNFEREALGYESQSMNYRAQAEINRTKADYLSTAKWIAPASTLLSTSARVADYWYKLR